MTSWRSAITELRRRPGRAMLSLFSVTIAVAAIVAVASAAGTTRQSYQHVFEALTGRTDLEVVARGGGRFDGQLAAPIRALSGVRAVVPVFHRATILYAHGRRAKVLAVGVVPDEPESMSGFKLAAGKLPSANDEILLDTGFAAGLKIDVGDGVRLLTASGLRPHQVSGLVSLEDASRAQQGGMLLVPLKRLQQVFRAADQVNALHVYLDKPDRADDVVAATAALLPPELRVGVPAARNALAEETLMMTEISLNMASALSFTTALFIVLNTFLMNVSERRRQLSILRAIGATRRQMIVMVCREALLLGLLGTALGLPLGVYGGKLLTQSMGGILQIKLPDSPNLGWPVLFGGLFGPAICLLAAWYPARRASQVSPLEGMRPAALSIAEQDHRSTTVLGLMGLMVTVAIGVVCVRGAAPAWVGVCGVIAGLLSTALLLPVALRPAIGVLAWPLRRVLDIEGEIAERLVSRHGGRSALTAGVLFIAAAAGVGTSNAVFSITADIRTWYERTITADFLLRTMMPDMSGQDAATMSESLGPEIAAYPGVEKVDGVRFLQVEASGADAILVARQFDIYDRAPLDIVRGDAEKLLPRLLAGEAVVGSVLAERAKLTVGDSINVTLSGASHAFRVAGVANEYSWGGSVVYLDRGVVAKAFKLEGVDAYLIKATAPLSPDLQNKLAALSEREGLLLQTYGEVLKLIDAMVAGVVGGLWVLLALGLLVGALGVVNTLTMNVLEQTRELGMLRAIGMQRVQIVRTVLAQAALIGLFGLVGGCMSGMFLARMINLCIGSLFGHQIDFALRPQSVVLLLAASLGVVMLAALFPARRAARLNPLEAMRLE